MPVLVEPFITGTRDTPACPTRTFTLEGAEAPGEQFAVSSVMAICALEIVCGVVSINGKTAPGARGQAQAEYTLRHTDVHSESLSS